MTKIIVYHSYYGCETGCCGHIVESDDLTMKPKFKFIHPDDEDFKKFAEKLVEETFGQDHVKDLDWENCTISDE